MSFGVLIHNYFGNEESFSKQHRWQYFTARVVRVLERVCQAELTHQEEGVFIRWNGTVEWNGGMERWNGMVEWNGGMEWWNGIVERHPCCNGTPSACAKKGQQNMALKAGHKR